MTEASKTSMRLGRFVAGAAGVVVGVLVVRKAIVHLRRARARANQRPPAPGGPKSSIKQAIEIAARVLQHRGPLEQFRLHLVGVRPLRDDPGTQVEMHLYCRLLNDDVAQCVIFDGDGPDARLSGVEYRISERLYDRLRPEEQVYWHPSNYELLSATLVAPGLPPVIERELVRLLLNSYAKTWSFWTDRPLPFGEARLAWSFNRDGESDLGIMNERDERLGVDADRRRRHRESLQWMAAPQAGEELLTGQFPQSATIDPSSERKPEE